MAGSCGRRVINDWADGRIDRSYPARCYRQALAIASPDLRAYSSLPADLRAALLNASGGIVPGGQPGKADGAKYERAVLGQRALGRRTPDIHHRDDDVLFQPGPTFVSGPAVGKSTLNLPLPLILLAVLALLLLAAGAAGTISRRLQARRAPPPG